MNARSYFAIAFVLFSDTWGRSDESKPVHTLPAPGDVKWIAITPDSQHLLTANECGYEGESSQTYELRLYHVATGKLVAGPIKSNGISSAGAISPDGKRAATGGYDCRVRLWELPDLKAVGQGLSLFGRVDRIAFAPDGKHFVMLNASFLKRLSDPIKSGRVTYRMETRSATTGIRVGLSSIWPRALAKGQTADGPSMGEPADWTETVGPAFTKDGHPQIPTGKAIELLEVPGDDENCGGVSAFAISPDRKLAASAGCNGEAVIWDYETRTVIGKKLPVGDRGHRVVRLTFSEDNRFIAVACENGHENVALEISVCDVKTRAIVAGPFKTGPLGTRLMRGLMLTPDGTMLAAACIRRGGEKPSSDILLWKMPAK